MNSTHPTNSSRLAAISLLTLCALVGAPPVPAGAQDSTNRPKQCLVRAFVPLTQYARLPQQRCLARSNRAVPAGFAPFDETAAAALTGSRLSSRRGTNVAARCDVVIVKPLATFFAAAQTRCFRSAAAAEEAGFAPLVTDAGAEAQAALGSPGSGTVGGSTSGGSASGGSAGSGGTAGGGTSGGGSGTGGGTFSGGVGAGTSTGTNVPGAQGVVPGLETTVPGLDTTVPGLDTTTPGADLDVGGGSGNASGTAAGTGNGSAGTGDGSFGNGNTSNGNAGNGTLGTGSGNNPANGNTGSGTFDGTSSGNGSDTFGSGNFGNGSTGDGSFDSNGGSSLSFPLLSQDATGSTQGTCIATLSSSQTEMLIQCTHTLTDAFDAFVSIFPSSDRVCETANPAQNFSVSCVLTESQGRALSNGLGQFRITGNTATAAGNLQWGQNI